MRLVIIYNEDNTVGKMYLLPESRLNPLIDYLKAVKDDDFEGTWSAKEQALFDGFSDAIPKDGM